MTLSSFIEDANESVDRAIQKHGLTRAETMRDLQFEDPIDLAKRLGTYNKVDRSAQYPPVRERYLPETLLRNDNLHFARLRQLRKDDFRDKVIILVIAPIVARLPEIMGWVLRLFF